MRKLLFTFLGIILLGTSSVWGGITENPRGCFTTEQEVSGFITTSPTLSFNLDTVITFTTIKDESGNSNGKLASSNTEWRTYYQYGKGPLTVSAKQGYWIHNVTFTYKEGADAILVNNKNDVTRVWNPGDTINILGTSRTWYTGHTKGTGGYLCFTKFKVVYYKLPTKIDMDASLTVEPNSVFKIGQILPYNAYQVWSTTDESKVSVDQNGVVTAKEEGSATIKVTFGDGTSKSCVVKVETSSDESVVEDFKEVVLGSVSTTTVEGKLANWEFVTIRRNAADTLRNGQKGSKFNAVATALYATKTELEGGIKRVSFYWNSASPFNENNHNFIVSAGNVKDTVIKLVVSESTKERIAKGDVIYTHDFNVKQNATLSITNNQTARYLLIGNIKVTPYLLYTTKTASVNCKTQATYDLKTGLIDNTNGTVTFKAEQASGWKGKINNGMLDLSDVSSTEDITVTASWESVTTTMKLTVTDAYAAVTGVTLNVTSPMDVTVGNQFQIIGTVAPNTANPKLTWSSSNDNIVEVDQNGIIKVKSADEATITATAVNGKSASCTINVTAGEYDSFEEDFSELPVQSTITATTKKFTSNDSIKWQIKNYKYDVDAKMGSEKYLQMQPHATSSYIAYNGTQEGGVKAVAFQWRAVDASKIVDFTIDDSNTSPTTGITYGIHGLQDASFADPQTFSQELNYTQNVYFRLKPTVTTNTTNIVFGPLTITPYLFYTVKKADAYEVGYKNDDLINNIPSGETVAYTLENNDGVAVINPSTGEITEILKEGTVTVKASWNEGKVYTTYQLTTHKTPEPMVSFADGDAVEKSMNVETYTNALVFDTPQEGCGEITYESDNKEVATVDNNGLVSIVGEGTANITAKIAKGTVYAAKNISYALTVEDPNEDAIIEKFTAYKDGGWTSTPTTESKRTGDYFDWNILRARHHPTDDKIAGTERATIFNPDNTSGGYIVSQNAVEGGIKRIGFNWAKNGVADGQFQVIVGLDTCTINSGATTVTNKAYNCNFFAKENATLKILNSSASKMYVGDIKITPYIYYTCKDTMILANDYVGTTFTNDSLINNIGSEGSITYEIENAASKTAIAKISDANSGAVTIHGAGTVKVIAKWSEGATTSYTLKIMTKPTVTMEGATIDAFGSYTAAPVAKIGETTIQGAQFSYKSSNELVATVDNGGVVTIKGVGITNIRAILAAGETYLSDSVDAVLKVNEPIGANYWKETFDSVPDSTSFVKDRSVYSGKKAVYQWQMRNFKHDPSGNKDKVGSERGIRIGFDSKNNNYIAFNRSEEGGIQAVFFNWCLAGSGTGTATFSRIAPKNDAKHSKNDTLTIVRENVSKGYDQVNSYVEVLNIDKNAPFQVRIPSGNESVVFGPMTFKPYLLYTTKDTTINVLDYYQNQTFTNDKLINNTGVEPEGEGITYSIKSVNPAGAVEILEANKHNGQVTINGSGTAVVQAKWGDVTTTYALNITGGDLELAFEQSHIDTTMNAEVLTNELSGVKTGAGALTYTSDNVRVAKVDKTTGVVSAMGPGDATITANVAAGTLYKAASANFTIHVAEVVEDSVMETFPDYQDSPWLSNATKTLDTVQGQLGDWGVLYARHKTTDKLPSNERAVWFNTDGYIKTTWAEGGIKRISFNYEKLTSADNKRFAVIAGNIADTIIAEAGQQEYTYNHNFFIKKNDTLKIHNISESASWPLLVGTVKITPYLYYTKRADTIQALDYIGKDSYFNEKLINNTETGTITYSSSNIDAAEVNASGYVTIKAAAAEPVIITAKWKTSENDSVTTSYSLRINTKQPRVASFASPKVSVERGISPVNQLNITTVEGESNPDTTFVSSNPEIAKIADDKKTIITLNPGTTTITAQIGATDKCLAGECSYELTVTYTLPQGSYWNETFKDAGDVNSYTTKTIAGDDDTPNKWKLTEFMRHTGDFVGTERGIRLKYEGNIASNIALEGGVKEVVFNWHPFSSTYAPHFYVQVGDSMHSISRPKAIDASKVIPYAHSFGEYGKSNTSLTIGNYAEETTAQGYVVIGEVNVIPYLLYTRKDTTLVAQDLAANNYKFFNNKLIKNIDEGTVSYSVKAKDNAVTMDGDSIRIIGAGIDTIQAAWEGVTTTYIVRVNLEDANLAFTKTKDTVLLKTETYQQEATAVSSATKKYELEGDHGDASIDSSSGLVTFNGYIGKLTIMATVPVALPYNMDTARYELQVNNLPTPEVIFNDTTVDMNSVPFVRPAQSIPASGMGQAHYTSDDKTVATVAELTGLITIVGAGDATISVHYDEGTEWGEKDVDFKLTVTDPMDEAIIEKFSTYSTTGWTGTPIVVTPRTGDYFDWNILRTRHKSTDLIGSERATIFNPDGTSGGYIESQEAVEGGIKRIGFNWSKNAVADGQFQVIVGLDTCTIYSGSTKVEKEAYNHNFLKKENASLKIFNSSASTMYVGEIKITPYLYYKLKNDTIKVGESYKNNHLIDNRDDEQAITYSIIAGNNKKVASIDTEGNVSATRACELTIQAKWGEHNVTTTYHLSIVPDKTTITLYRNDGTAAADTIVNVYGQPMPAIRPVRDGYRFNAYWTDEKTEQYRFTVTRLDTATVWVANRRIGNDTLVDAKRNWVYQGTEYTFYAQWAPERTIALDNQGADAGKVGTASIVTAYCPNNNTTRLTTITVPTKEDSHFLGYYTETEGQGSLLIDATGAFIKDVAGYTDSVNNWVYDANITLYAYWVSTILVTKPVDVTTIPENANVEVQDGGTITMNENRTLGDVTINEGGAVALDNTLTVSNLVIKSTMGGTGESGQITGLTPETASKLDVKGEAYYDLTLGADADPTKWHAFTVPFAVDPDNGISNAANGNALKNGKDYAIYVYDGQKRANGTTGWKKNVGNLQPGTFYMLTIAGGVSTFRMKMEGEFSVASNQIDVEYYTGTGAKGDEGWNGIGNSQLDYRTVGDNVVMVFNPSSNGFDAVPVKDAAQFSVGTPFFYQSGKKKTITLEVPSPSAPMRAISNEPKEITISLANADFTDRLYISSTEEATNEYQIGRDLGKMSMTSTPTVPQIAAKAYNTKLCMIDAPMAGDEATYALSLYAPKAGEYTLKAEQIEGYEVYLTNNGDVIWNLSKNDYSVSLEKGNNDTYGLVLKKLPNTPTGMQNAQCTMQGVQKFIYNEQLIINRDGKMYNGTGALVK